MFASQSRTETKNERMNNKYKNAKKKGAKWLFFSIVRENDVYRKIHQYLM